MCEDVNLLSNLQRRANKESVMGNTYAAKPWLKAGCVFTGVSPLILVQHPDIENAATIGLPDPKRPGSEIVASAVVLKPGLVGDEAMREKIMLYMKENLAPYKVPKVIQFMTALPFSSVGKVLKRELYKIMSTE